MRALVTGSLGFAGTHLVSHLRAEGDEVIGIDRTDGDLTDPDVVLKLLVAHEPEVVYHLAGASDVGGSWRDPVGTWHANATVTLHVLEAARQVVALLDSAALSRKRALTRPFARDVLDKAGM